MADFIVYPAIGVLLVAAIAFGVHKLAGNADWHLHRGKMRRWHDGRWQSREATQRDVDDADDANAW